MFLNLNKKTKILSGILAALLLSALLIRLTNVPIFSVDSHGEVSESFTSVDELKQKAEVIIEADILNEKAMEYKNVVFTLSNAIVKKSYKGNLQNNGNIKILETGGVYNNIEYTFEGYKTLRTNDKAILFLKKYNGPVTNEESYVVLGVYQGKFNLDSAGNIIGKQKDKSTELGQITNKKSLNLE